MKKIAIVLLAGLTLAGCKTAEQAFIEAGKKPLSAETLKTLLVGNTVNGHGATFTFSTYVNPDGTTHGKNTRGAENSGTWKISADNTVCWEWKDPRWINGCSKYFDDKGEYVQMLPDGTEHYRFAVEKGNPKGL